MPLEGAHAGDTGMEMTDGPVCKFDIEGGALKSPEAIFRGGVEFFLSSAANGDRSLAERLTRKNMRALPYWQSHPFADLSGAEASDDEFAAAMAALA